LDRVSEKDLRKKNESKISGVVTLTGTVAEEAMTR
jgi:hypothetical protein